VQSLVVSDCVTDILILVYLNLSKVLQPSLSSDVIKGSVKNGSSRSSLNASRDLSL